MEDGIAMSKWEVFAIDQFYEDAPDFSGVYAVFNADGLLYIGSSVAVVNRFRQHGIRFRANAGMVSTPWGDFEHITIKVRKSERYGDWAMIELRLLRRLRPLRNKRVSRRVA